MKYILLGISIICIIVGTTYVYDGHRTSNHTQPALTGSIAHDLQTPSLTPPRLVDHKIIATYTHPGVIKNQPRIIHATQDILSTTRWIRNIQYIGKFVTREQAPGLFDMIANLSSIAPTRAYPYAFVQYIGPLDDTRNDIQINHDTAVTSWERTIALGLQGINLTCNTDKIQHIINLSDADRTTLYQSDDTTYDNPCADYQLPHTLAFNYFYYMDDLESAIHYYRIAAMHDNAPSATASMPIVLRSQQGQHLISAQLLYDQAAVLAEREESPELIDQTILEAVYELQLHLLTTADSANDTCTQNYSCLQLALTREIGSLVNSCASQVSTIECTLLAIALEDGYITTSGDIYSPTDNRSNNREYNTRRNIWRIKVQ